MSWLDDVPFARKLHLVMLITSSLALLVACGVFLTVEYVTYRQNLQQTVSTVARLTAINSTAAIAFGDKADAQKMLDALRAEPQIVAAALYDNKGGAFATYSESKHVLPSTLSIETPERTIFEAAHIDVILPVIEGELRVGTLYMRASFEQMYGRMRIYTYVVLGVMAGSFIVAWLAASALQRTVSRPILELAQTASAVANGSDFSLRARHYGRDELGQLTTAFNIMLERTQASVEKVAQARDQALAASRAKDEFLAALSHELRTPLNPVLMLASDAAGNPDLPQAVREDFSRIAKHVTLEARLIDDLLDLTRITRGKLSLDLRACDAHTILRDAISTVRPEAEARELEITIRLADGAPVVRGDAVRLQQVFWNVLKNAVKFTPEGGRIGIDTRLPEGGKAVTITVTDSGIGMTATEIERAFEAFSQGEHGENGGGHRFGGLGLGLAITRTLIELHGGSIRAHSEGRNKGSAFVMELPLIEAQEGLAAASKASGEERADYADAGADGSAIPVRNGPPVSVLVVEDHAATRVALVRLLTRRHFEVTTASTLAEAREAINRRDFDLIVSDIGLPDGSGCTLMAELRAKKTGMPGIALSGYGMEDDLARSQAAGFNAHLTKPINVKTLDEAIARLLPGAAESA